MKKKLIGITFSVLTCLAITACSSSNVEDSSSTIAEESTTCDMSVGSVSENISGIDNIYGNGVIDGIYYSYSDSAAILGPINDNDFDMISSSYDFEKVYMTEKNYSDGVIDYTNTYDELGNMISSEGYYADTTDLHSKGDVVRTKLYKYDDRGNLVWKYDEQTGAFIHEYIYEYDDDNNLIREGYRNLMADSYYTYTYLYDDNSNVVCKGYYQDDRYEVTDFSYNEYNDVVLEEKSIYIDSKLNDFYVYEYEYEYNEEGEILKKDFVGDVANKNILEQEFDEEGRLIRSINYGLDYTEKYWEYDDHGHLIWEKVYSVGSSSGYVTDYEHRYDCDGLEIHEEYSLTKETDGNGNVVLALYKDSKGNIYEKKTYDFNADGQLVEECIESADGVEAEASYKYDEEGRIIYKKNYVKNHKLKEFYYEYE